MSPHVIGRLARLFRAANPARGRMLDGFVDTLLQTFENCRPGISDETVKRGSAAVTEFCLELYDRDLARLREAIEREHAHLPEPVRRELLQRVDERIRKVLIPAYARLAAPLTQRERNDFYALPGNLHGVERVAWAAGGILVGAFVIWAPFIPLWEKEWILPFAAAGLFFPEIRRYVALRRYEGELNRLIARLDEEIWRMDLAYWTSGDVLRAGAAGPAAVDEARVSAAAEELPERLDSAPRETSAGHATKRQPTVREGGR